MTPGVLLPGRDDWNSLDARVRAHQIALGRASPSPSLSGHFVSAPTLHLFPKNASLPFTVFQSGRFGSQSSSRDGGFQDWDADQSQQGWSRQRSSSISGSDSFRAGPGSAASRFGGDVSGFATLRRGATPQPQRGGIMSSASVSNLHHPQPPPHPAHPAHFGMMQQVRTLPTFHF